VDRIEQGRPSLFAVPVVGAGSTDSNADRREPEIIGEAKIALMQPVGKPLAIGVSPVKSGVPRSQVGVRAALDR